VLLVHVVVVHVGTIHVLLHAPLAEHHLHEEGIVLLRELHLAVGHHLLLPLLHVHVVHPEVTHAHIVVLVLHHISAVHELMPGVVSRLESAHHAWHGVHVAWGAGVEVGLAAHALGVGVVGVDEDALVAVLAKAIALCKMKS